MVSTINLQVNNVDNQLFNGAAAQNSLNRVSPASANVDNFSSSTAFNNAGSLNNLLAARSSSLPETFDINLSVSSIAIQLAQDPEAVARIIQQASNLDASGGITDVTANGTATGVTGSSTASALFDITPTTVGTFNPASRALDAINTIITMIETNDVNAFASIFEQEGAQISPEQSAQIFNQLQRNQALIRTALAQSVAREQQRNTDLDRAAQLASDRRSRSNNLAQPGGNNGGGPGR